MWYYCQFVSIEYSNQLLIKKVDYVKYEYIKTFDDENDDVRL